MLGGAGGGAPILYTESYFCSPTSTEQQQEEEEEGLLLLIPLVLGLGQINPIYLPQLRHVLSIPQSVGIVGGKPGSSLYIVGCQGGAALYLDPHTIQPAAQADEDWETCSCDVLRTLALPSIDPSMALGFYCRGKREWEELCDRLGALEGQHPASPLVCVRRGGGGERGEEGGEEQAWEADSVDSGDTGAKVNGGGNEEEGGGGGGEREEDRIQAMREDSYQFPEVFLASVQLVNGKEEERKSGGGGEGGLATVAVDPGLGSGNSMVDSGNAEAFCADANDKEVVEPADRSHVPVMVRRQSSSTRSSQWEIV